MLFYETEEQIIKHLKKIIKIFKLWISYLLFIILHFTNIEFNILYKNLKNANHSFYVK